MSNLVFIDTEFYEFSPYRQASPNQWYVAPGANAVQLISLGATKPTGETFYAEFMEFDWNNVPEDHWLQENVRPLTNVGFGFSTGFIRNDFLDWCGPNPEFWAYYGDYDWVALCGLYGRMTDLPEGWPMFCRDVRQLIDDKPGVELPPMPDNAHHALHDAIWACKTYRRLTRGEG